MQPPVYVLIFRVSKFMNWRAIFFCPLSEFSTFVLEGVGHIDNLQMREDAGRTQWNRVGSVYTRVSQALESCKNHSLLLDLRFVSCANGPPKKRSVLFTYWRDEVF